MRVRYRGSDKIPYKNNKGKPVFDDDFVIEGMFDANPILSPYIIEQLHEALGQALEERKKVLKEKKEKEKSDGSAEK
jgi:hypothetical protein